MAADSPTSDARADTSPALNATDFASAVTAITSAFGDPTRRDIFLWLRDDSSVAEAGGATAAEVAQRFDLHANVARHHLDKLVGGGYVDVSVGKAPGRGAGRPSKRYAVPAGRPLEFPVRHDDLLVALLGRTLAALPAEEAATLAEEVGVEYGRTMAATMRPAESAQQSFRAALHSVAEALTAHGFAAHAEHDGAEGLRIVAQHCPFGETAIDHPVICAVDRGLVKGMLSSLYGETSPATEATVAGGSETCVTVVASRS